MKTTAEKPDIVISGISGQYPLSEDIENFKENLFAGVDMVTADDARWPIGYQRLPARNGKVYGMNLIDNKFFGLTDEEVDLIDPQDRLLMEEVYAALWDAGVDPRSLRGSNTGYFHGACYVETHRSFDSAETIPEGRYKTLITRIPRFLGLRGPVLDVDTACGSGLSAFSEAYYSIKSGICDAAIATASNTVFRPRISSQFRDLKMISKDGKCKCLDADADGYVRSEAVVAIFLQRAEDAKRIYCFLLGCRSNSDGYKEEGITFPSTKGQIQLLEDTYRDAGVNAADIDYVEAHITGTKAGDPVETGAMYEVICRRRKDPVKIGCLKSNIGHTEGSSGLCAISKAIIVYQTRMIPPNIHYKTPNISLKGLKDGKMMPVAESTPFTGHYIPVNCFGFGGANTHLITADLVPGKNSSYSNLGDRKCDPNIFLPSLPYRLVNISGRTKESVEYIYSALKRTATGNQPDYRNREFLSLLDDFSNSSPNDFPFRGFMILGKDLKGKTTVSFTDVSNRLERSLSLTLNFPGPDVSTAVAFDEMKESLPTFRRISKMLESLASGKILPVSQIIAKSVAFQISMANLLKEVGVPVNQVTGHSTGELTCAYMKGIISEETALSTALMVLDDTDKVGLYLLSKMKTNSLSPTTEWTNSWSTDMNEVDLLERLSRFSHRVSFDSATDLLLRVDYRLNIRGSHVVSNKTFKKDEIINSPTFSLLSCLGFLYTRGIPVNVGAASSSLIPPVDYPLPPSTPFLSPLIRWDHSTPTSLKNYLHDASSALAYQTTKNIVYRFDQNKAEDTFLFDHRIDGRVLFPATGYLMIVWSALAKLNKNLTTEFPVRFDNVKFRRAVVVSGEGETILSVRINEDSGTFELKEGDVVIVTGQVTALDPNVTSVTQVIPVQDNNISNSSTTLSSRDIYKELRIRGYDYGPFFQGIVEADCDGAKGKIVWREVISKQVKENLSLETGEDHANLWIKSWCTFTDSMLQMQLLKCKSDSRCLIVPTSIDSMIVLPEEIRASLGQSATFNDQLTQLDATLFSVQQDSQAGLIYSPGVVVKGFKGSLLPRKKQLVKLLRYHFHPFDRDNCLDRGAKNEKLLQEYENALIKEENEKFDLEDERFSLLRKLTREKAENRTEDESQTPIPIDRDILCGGVNNGFILAQQSFFKSAFDVIIYNLITGSSKTSVDILEVNLTPSSLSTIMSERVKECLNEHLLYTQYSVNCHLMTTTMDSITDEVKDEYKDIIQVDDALLNDDSKMKEKVPSSHIALVYVANVDNLLPLITRRAGESVREGGFVMITYRSPMKSEKIEKMVQNTGIGDNFISQIIQSSLKDGFTKIMERKLCDSLPYRMILLRKDDPSSHEMENVIIQVGTTDFDSWLDSIKDLLTREEEPNSKKKKVWITANARDALFSLQISGIMGFAKSLRLESGGDRVRVLLDYTTDKPITDLSSADYVDVLRKDLAYNVRHSKEQGWGSYEHFFLPDALEESESFEETEHVYLRSLKPGDLSSLTWVTNCVPTSKKFLENHVKVFYSGLNFKDVLYATGRLSVDAVPAGVSPLATQDSLLGLEYSGIDTSGRRVMGILPFKGLASSIPITDKEKDFMWTVPPNWTLDEAATVPVVYSTVIYALLVRGKIVEGESILIHAGAGGVGLAAIQVSLHFGLRVFTTVGSEEKRIFLKEYFAGLKEDDIFNSRDTTFEEKILRATEGKGVDVILNSLSDEKFDSSLRILHSSHGRFLEIGKVDMLNDKQLRLSYALNGNQSFHGVFLDTLTTYGEDDYFSQHVIQEKDLLKQYMEQGIREGFVRPLPRVKYERDRVEEAFRFMATGKHIGKVVIEMRKEGHQVKQPLSVKSLKATFMSPDKSYLVLGGLGGLGLELVQWLVTKGARNILINSRRGVSNNYQKMVISRLRKEGVNVSISQTDSTNRDGVKKLIEEANSMAELGVGGIFNSAVVYKDCLFSDQTVDIFEQVSSPKSNATIFLDDLSRAYCPNLDYFVAFSSISSGRGNEGQTNYNFGNSVMDSICLSRASKGLPGLSVQWGVIGDVGLVADIHSGHGLDGSSSSGGSPIKAAATEVVLLGSASQRVHSIFETLDRIINYRSIGCIASIVRPSNQLKVGKEGAADLMKLISNIIGLKDISRMDTNTSLGSLGIDSLIAVEIKQVIERVTGVSLGLKEVRELTISGIMELATGGGKGSGPVGDKNMKKEKSNGQ